MEISSLTSKYQATIPLAVRNKLGLKKGDKVSFRITNGQVFLEKAEPIDWEFTHFSEQAMTEWSSPEDEEAFRDLQPR